MKLDVRRQICDYWMLVGPKIHLRTFLQNSPRLTGYQFWITRPSPNNVIPEKGEELEFIYSNSQQKRNEIEPQRRGGRRKNLYDELRVTAVSISDTSSAMQT
jgi:hypothetical protein